MHQSLQPKKAQMGKPLFFIWKENQGFYLYFYMFEPSLLKRLKAFTVLLDQPIVGAENTS